MKRFIAIFALAALATTAASNSAASLIGDTVTCSDTAFGACNPGSATVVDPGAEFIQYSLAISINVGASQIQVSDAYGGNTNLMNARVLTIGDLDFTPTEVIIGFTLASASGVSNLTQSDLSFGTDFVSVDFQDVFFTPGGSATLTIETSRVGSVPEPGTLALLGLGLAGLAASRRRKQ